MSSTQTQLRGGTSAQIAAMTPVEREVLVNTTTDRVHVGDGSKAGGFEVPNVKDIQSQTVIYGTVGGTANAITLTHTPVVSAYVTPQRFVFKATATNTGATTVNVDTLGVKNIYKISAGSLTALAAGDIVNGGLYAITYDGTQFQISSGVGGGSSASTAEIAGESAVEKFIRPDRAKYHPGIAKAWARFQFGGVTTVNDSDNVSSITTTGPNAIVNFSTAMPDTSYAVLFTAENGDVPGVIASKTTSSFRINDTLTGARYYSFMVLSTW